MKLPRPRFNVRGLMVLVAILALGYSFFQWFQLYQRCRMSAVFHDEKQKYLTLELKNLKRFPPSVFVSPYRRQEFERGERDRAESLRKKIEYHGRMKQKYEEAASRPWDSVAPDPPEPN